MPLYLFIAFILLWFIVYIVYKKLTKDRQIAPVWNCGYPYIEPRTQYTSTSFIQPLRRIFADIYGEIKHIDPKKVNQDSKVEYKKNLSHIEYSHKNKYFTDIVYKKLINLISWIAIKVKSLQNGQIQTYIFYIFWAVIISVTLVLFFN